MRHRHPAALDRSKPGGHYQSGRDKQPAGEQEHERHAIVLSPQKEAAQSRQSEADGEAELAALRRRQSSSISSRQSTSSFHSGWFALSSKNGQSTR